MCNKHSTVIATLPNERKVRVDPCMKKEIEDLNSKGIHTLACCCGHGVYPETIIVDGGGKENIIYEHYTGWIIPRKKRFYRKDKNGLYYVPEVR